MIQVCLESCHLENRILVVLNTFCMIMSLSTSAKPSAYISMRFGSDEIIDTSNELCQVINQCSIGISLWHKAIKRVKKMQCVQMSIQHTVDIKRFIAM